MTTHVLQALPPWQWSHSSLRLMIQTLTCAPGTHYPWMDRGSVEYEVCLTLLHMASTGNRAPDLLLLDPTPYPRGHLFSSFQDILDSQSDGYLVLTMKRDVPEVPHTHTVHHGNICDIVCGGKPSFRIILKEQRILGLFYNSALFSLCSHLADLINIV